MNQTSRRSPEIAGDNIETVVELLPNFPSELQKIIANILAIRTELQSRRLRLDEEGYIDTTQDPAFPRRQNVITETGIDISHGVTQNRLVLSTRVLITPRGQLQREASEEDIIMDNIRYYFPDDGINGVRSIMNVTRRTTRGMDIPVLGLVTTGVRRLNSGPFHPKSPEIYRATPSKLPRDLSIELFDGQSPADLLLRFRENLRVALIKG